MGKFFRLMKVVVLFFVTCSIFFFFTIINGCFGILQEYNVFVESKPGCPDHLAG